MSELPAATKNHRSVSKKTSKPVLVHFPKKIIAAVDGLVEQDDTDRSKWIRQAVREKMQRHGIVVA